MTKNDFTTQTSQAVADAAFTAGQGAIVPPARGGLGWYVLRVDKIENTPARSLADVRNEIAKTLGEEQRKAAFADFAANIEDQLDNGQRLAEIAKTLKAEIESTEPLTADGKVYGKEETAPPILAPALKTAFQMEEGQPQLAEVDPGKTYIVFEAENITPSAAAPLAEIKDRVTSDWRKAEGAKAAKAAAQRVLQRLTGGQDLAAALAAEKVKLPPAQTIDMGRDQLAQQGRIPAPLALMFSMAKGTVKRLEAPQDNGWFVVKLDDISLPALDKNDPLIGATRQQLAGVFGSEYAEELVHAAQRSVGAKKNQAAIDAVAKQLTGRSE